MKHKARKKKKSKIWIILIFAVVAYFVLSNGDKKTETVRAMSLPSSTEVVISESATSTLYQTSTPIPTITPTPTSIPISKKEPQPTEKIAEKSQYPFSGYISIDEIVVQNEPTFSSESVTTLWYGTDITVLDLVPGIKGTKQSWYEINFTKNNKILKGYVPIRSVSPLTSMQVYNATISLDALLSNKQALPTGYSDSVPKEGNAVVVFQDYGVYTGSFKDGQRSGQGSFIWETKDRYDGQWEKDQINGKGILTWADGTVYNGTFSKGKLTQGNITVSLNDRRKIVYTVSDGIIKQKCTLTWPDGTTIVGNCKNNSFVGEVTISYANGDKYIGQLQDGLKSGQGIYTWKNGASYKGEWSKDQMDGDGYYYFSTDKKINYLQGKFKNNQPYGTITYMGTNGIKYDTVWSNGTCTKISVKK